ncbi:MAG: DoxX family membrane protein [Sphingosinicella sp.]|nr:DoxX family membrane protein [Sphingosinicella sp.]
MNRLIRTGPFLFGAGFVLLGLVGMVFLTLVPGLQPTAEDGRVANMWVYLNGIILILGGVGLWIRRTRQIAALALALTFTLWTLAAHVPKLIGDADDVGAWVSGFEALAIAGVASTLSGRSVGRWPDLAGRLCLGAALFAFGLVHFLYHDFIASMIPGWLPAKHIWPWFTGSVNIVAALSILTGHKGHLGAAGVGLMYASWIILVHPGRIAVDFASSFEWSFLGIAIVLTGAAWIMFDRLRPSSPAVKAPRPIQMEAGPE